MTAHRPVDIAGRTPVAADPGPAPMLQWVGLADLVIDDAYQRPLGPHNWKVIQRIAANFRWSRFGPIQVAPISGGRFAVIDGQHRAHAAALCGFDRVPCMAVQVEQAEQSLAFGWINATKINVSAFQVYRAALTGGEDWAVRADRAVAAAGCRLALGPPSSKLKAPGVVYCPALIRRLIDLGYDEAITAGLAALTRTPAMHKIAAYANLFLQDWLPAVHASGFRDPKVLSAALVLCDPFKLVEDATASRLAGPARKKARKVLVYLIRQKVKRDAGISAARPAPVGGAA